MLFTYRIEMRFLRVTVMQANTAPVVATTQRGSARRAAEHRSDALELDESAPQTKSTTGQKRSRAQAAGESQKAPPTAPP